MKYIGAHVSTAGGVYNAPQNAINIGAKAFAMFVKNQRQWYAKPLTDDVIEKFKSELKKSKITAKHVVPHSGYLINLGHPDIATRKKSIEAFLFEAECCERLGLQLLNFHPGHHLNLISETECLNNIAESINHIIANTKNLTFLIENTSGQGSALGYCFEHLNYLIKKIKNKKRIGVCIDTCHLFASGYDIRTKETFTKTWQEFEAKVGFKYLKAMHLNDSKTELGSKKDRHHSIGKGNIGINAFKLLMQDKRFDEIPLILETIDPELWPEEISLLESMC